MKNSIKRKNFNQAEVDAKREQRRELMNLVNAMTPEQRQELVQQRGAISSCTGSALSIYNTCLILHQNPEASVVGGFNQWKAMGRVVRKGEKALCIWVPTQRKGEAEDGSEDRTGFVGGNVFDISQTDELDENGNAIIHPENCLEYV